MTGYAQWDEPDGVADPARLPARGYLVESPPGTFAPTVDPAEATHTHALDPETGDLVVETLAAASGVRTRVLAGTLSLYGF